MNYRVSERMMLSACAAGILIVMLGNRRQSLTMSAVGAGMMVLGLLQALLFYKCPHCKKRFKLGARRPSVCPYCGISFVTDEAENGIYVYKKDNKYYAEQGYNGIYEISKESFESLKEYIISITIE